MNSLQNIYNVTNETFQTMVVERSREVPVLVDFWADWCGPCQMLMPVLKKLVDEYDGKFVLAKVNTDEQRELAKTHGIRSLPTLHVYKQGELVEEILAAQSEATMRTILDRYIERESDRLRARAKEAYQQGQHDAALALLEDAHAEEPDNHQLALDYAELCLREAQLEKTASLLAALPRDVRDETEAMRLRALLDFALAIKDAPPVEELETTVSREPDNLEARYQLGAWQVLNDRFEDALETFMQLLQHDRSFRDDAGRRGLLAIFELLDNKGDLVTRYRRKLFNLLH
ncbi:MAG TPA: thioredoxin [Gammaproteobacteria bacterium]|nr:thioredoxin [Gammaproteobacteria bacterium]